MMKSSAAVCMVMVLVLLVTIAMVATGEEACASFLPPPDTTDTSGFSDSHTGQRFEWITPTTGVACYVDDSTYSLSKLMCLSVVHNATAVPPITYSSDATIAASPMIYRFSLAPLGDGEHFVLGYLSSELEGLIRVGRLDPSTAALTFGPTFEPLSLVSPDLPPAGQRKASLPSQSNILPEPAVMVIAAGDGSAFFVTAVMKDKWSLAEIPYTLWGAHFTLGGGMTCVPSAPDASLLNSLDPLVIPDMVTGITMSPSVAALLWSDSIESHLWGFLINPSTGAVLKDPELLAFYGTIFPRLARLSDTMIGLGYINQFTAFAAVCPITGTYPALDLGCGLPTTIRNAPAFDMAAAPAPGSDEAFWLSYVDGDSVQGLFSLITVDTPSHPLSNVSVAILETDAVDLRPRAQSLAPVPTGAPGDYAWYAAYRVGDTSNGTSEERRQFLADLRLSAYTLLPGGVTTPSLPLPHAPLAYAINIDLDPRVGVYPRFCLVDPLPGMTINGSGVIHWTPAQGGSFTVEVLAFAPRAYATYTIDVASLPTALEPIQIVGISTHTVNVTWETLTVPLAPITSFRLERSLQTDGEGPWTTLYEGPATFFSHGGLTPLTSYTYRVRGINAVGVGAASSPVTAKTYIECGRGTRRAQAPLSQSRYGPCLPCEPGTYSSVAGSQCVACPFSLSSQPGAWTPLNCSCAPGWYQPDALANTECLVCPKGADCSAGGLGAPVALPGWFAVPTGAGDNALAFEECVIAEACVGGSAVCARGYAGYLCGECSPGWYADANGFCRKCPGLSWMLLMVFILFATLSGLLIVKLSQPASHDAAVDSANRSSRLPHSLGVLVIFIQLVALMGDLKINWPDAVQDIAFDMFRFVNLDINLFASECTLESFYGKYALVMLCPALIGLSSLAVYVVAHYVLHASWITVTSLPRMLERVFVVCAPLVYIPLSRATLVFFQCVRLPDKKWYFRSDLSVRCFDASWWSIFPLAAIATVAYVLALPVFLGWVLRSINTDDPKTGVLNPVFLERYGVLYRMYRVRYYWFEWVVCIRKLAIVILALFLADQPVWQLALLVAIFVASNVVTQTLRPYYNPSYNQLQLRVDSLLLCIVLLGFAFYSDQSREEGCVRCGFPGGTRVFFIIVAVAVIFGGLLLILASVGLEIKEKRSLKHNVDGDVREQILWQYIAQNLDDVDEALVPAIRALLYAPAATPTPALAPAEPVSLAPDPATPHTPTPAVPTRRAARRAIRHSVLLRDSFDPEQGIMMANLGGGGGGGDLALFALDTAPAPVATQQPAPRRPPRQAAPAARRPPRSTNAASAVPPPANPAPRRPPRRS